MRLRHFFSRDTKQTAAARYDAQRIALAPIVFQASLALRDLGLLEAVEKSGDEGIEPEDLAKRTGLSVYGTRVLIEAGLGIGLLVSNREKYRLTKTGALVLRDEMTRVNMDFVQDVCYRGLSHLQEAVKSGTPAGPKEFGRWPTIYEALGSLPPHVRESWLRFDHFYSDAAFPRALAAVLEHRPRTVYDVGGNTGRFAVLCARTAPEVSVTILDLPEQLRMAEETLGREGLRERVSLHATDLLDSSRVFPKGADAVWMSQLLDCFSEDEAVSIMLRARAALNDGGAVYVLEPCWDRQRFEESAFCLQQLSLYFTAMANGNSRFFDSRDLLRCAGRAGLRVDGQEDALGIGHTLFRFVVDAGAAVAKADPSSGAPAARLEYRTGGRRR